jgi:hypothetical protein
MTRRLVRKVLNKLDMLVCEPACGVAGDGDHAYQLILEDDWDAEQREEPNDLLSLVGVVGVVPNIRDLLGLSTERDATDDRRAIARVRVLVGVVVGRFDVVCLG